MSYDKETTILVGEDTVAMARAKWAGAIASHVQPMATVGKTLEDKLSYDEMQELKRQAFELHERHEFTPKQHKPNKGLKIGSYRFKTKKQ